MKQLRGIIMCGGQSKRMGTDKGLIAIHNTCWAAYMADKLTALGPPISISINASQIEKYQSIFTSDCLVVDSLDLAGPLNGLLSVHTKYPDDDLLLLACDMINMQTETLKHLIKCYQTELAYNYYVYQNKEYAEPFCGIYKREGLSDIDHKYNVANQAGLSFQKILNSGNTKRLQITSNSCFDNYNTTPFEV